MITKKVISQTIPTVYNDKNEFNNSSENFSVTSTLNTLSPSNVQKQALNQNRTDLKSVNYFGSKSSLNLKKSNQQIANSNNLNQAKKSSNYYNFNSNSYNFYNTSFANENLEKFKTNSNFDFNQDSFIIPKNKQQSFQKYAIERHINHFKPQHLDLNNTKLMITKMLNGTIDDNQKNESNQSTKEFHSTSGPIKNEQAELSKYPVNGHSSKQTATSGAQSNSKSSTYSEMDVSSPFADLKQITVQNKPLGGKKIQIQNTNPFSATKYGLESKQISTNPTVTKYASVSNGTLTSSNTNGLSNGASLTGVVNGNGTNATNLTSNLMRSLLSSSNKSGNRNYFNHLSSSNNNNNNINTSNNSLNTNSTNNIFVDNDLSTYSLLPSDSYKNNLNNSTYLNGNSSMITATMPMHQHAGYNTIRGMQSREKTIAQINQNVTDRASRDSKVNNVSSNLRKENSFYMGSKENNSNPNTSLINGNVKDKNHHLLQTQIASSNVSQVDANSIVNSFFGNNSTISTNSQQQKARSSTLNHSRSVLSSKQLNNQTPIANHHKKDDCLTSNEAIQLYGDKLTDFEKQEINEYAEIWYLGLDAEKINAQNVKDYDDENGAYLKVNKDQIAYRYEIIETLGKGSFGQVLKCFDHKRKEHVAVKIIRSKKRFQQQGMVEVNILQHLKNLDHDNAMNVVHMKEYFYFRNHLCISFEILGINLYELIKKNNYQGFSIHLVRRFAYSILQCMKVMYRENIIHCDMKPENILLRQKGSSAIKVIDFGSGCFESQRIYTYIQSRFYRAPEIILGIPYTTAIDMWSFGCILVELFTGYPIFPGENEAEQLAMIMEVIDLPPAHILAEASRRKLFFDSKNMPRNLNTKLFKKRRVGSKSLAQILKTNDTNFIDFVSRCLEWDPAVRMNAEDALKHPWILELKKKSSKDIRPKHRHRREAETSIEHENTHYAKNERSFL